jgi:hypothetical protein
MEPLKGHGFSRGKSQKADSRRLEACENDKTKWLGRWSEAQHHHKTEFTSRLFSRASSPQ